LFILIIQLIFGI